MVFEVSCVIWQACACTSASCPRDLHFRLHIFALYIITQNKAVQGQGRYLTILHNHGEEIRVSVVLPWATDPPVRVFKRKTVCALTLTQTDEALWPRVMTAESRISHGTSPLSALSLTVGFSEKGFIQYEFAKRFRVCQL